MTNWAYDQVDRSVSSERFLALWNQRGPRLVQAVNEKQRKIVVDVRDWGNVGGGNNDDTTAIQQAADQAAIAGITTVGAEVRLPVGRCVIMSAITVQQNKHVAFTGSGRSSALLWGGSNNSAMIEYVGGDGSPDCKAYVERIGFIVGAQTGIVGVQSGSGSVGFGLTNLTVRECAFQNVDVAVETFTETDSVVIEDNWALVYHSACFRMSGGGTNSSYSIRNNHCQGGDADSWAIDHTGGTNIVIDGNSAESGTQGARGIRLSAVSDFRVVSNRFEVNSTFGSTDGPFLSLIASTNGMVGANATTGDTGNSIGTIDADCSNIQIGPNRHGVSGGTPTAWWAVESGATDIFIFGKQEGANAPYSGAVSTYWAGDYLTTTKPISQFNASVNVNASATATLFTLPASSGYRVQVSSATDDLYATGDVVRTSTGSALLLDYNTSGANLALSVSGNDLQVTNGAGATRTVAYSAMRTI